MELLLSLLFLPIMYFMVKALWISTLLLDQRKKNYRAGTHDYYGNKIEKSENNG